MRMIKTNTKNGKSNPPRSNFFFGLFIAIDLPPVFAETLICLLSKHSHIPGKPEDSCQCKECGNK